MTLNNAFENLRDFLSSNVNDKPKHPVFLARGREKDSYYMVLSFDKSPLACMNVEFVYSRKRESFSPFDHYDDKYVGDAYVEIIDGVR